MPEEANSQASFSLYPYDPSQVAAIIAASLFSISAIYHTFQVVRKRTWFYIPLTVGALMMSAGYIVRIISMKSPDELSLYIGQSLFIILPPSLYAATIYMIYGRIVRFLNIPNTSIIGPNKVTKIFVAGDVLAFLLQAAGGGMMAQASQAKLGQKVIMFGLFVQLIFFGFFFIISIVFWKRVRGRPEYYTAPKPGKHSWEALFKLLLVAAVIIILRCVFRMIEFGQGHDGYLVNHEVYMYIFDAAPMFLVQAMFHFYHAGDVFNTRGMVQKDDESYINLREY